MRLQSNRSVLCINFNVTSRICLFTESGKSLSPYNNSCNKISFARSTYPSGRSNAKIPARRSRLCTSKQGLSNKKCSLLLHKKCTPFANDPSAMAGTFQEIFESLLNIHAPIKKRRVRSEFAPWLTPSLRKSMETRDRLKK